MTRRVVLPDVETLRQTFDYDPITGCLKWKVKASQRCKAGTPISKATRSGYILVRFKGKLYSAHRLIWKLYYGEEPPHEIDHENRNTADNRIKNLRAATRVENMCNTGSNKSSTSGVKGVSWNKRQKKWTACIRYNKIRYHLGCFIDKASAEQAVKLKREELHKEYANHG